MLQDVKLAARSARRRPAFALFVIVTLAAGIGATSAMFSIVHSVLIRPLPFERADDLVYGFGSFPGGDRVSVSPMDFRDYRAQSHAFSSLAAHTPFGVAVLSDGDEPERVRAPFVTANLFTTLQVRPLIGRTFLPEEEEGGPHLVVILSHSLWQRRFGGDPRAVGRSTTLDGKRYVIVGVMPPAVEWALGDQLWRPFAFNLPETNTRRARMLRLIGRLRPDVSVAAAQREIDLVSGRIAQSSRENEGWGVRLVPYQDVVVGTIGPTLWYLLGAVGLVLLSACANVANLMLARTTTRQGEMAVRTALGASRGRLVWQLFVESLLLAVAAGGLGLLLALLIVQATRTLGAEILPRAAEIRVDGMAILFTAITTVMTAVLFGLTPALRTTRRELATSMAGKARTTGTARTMRVRDALVVVQVALSLVLLVGAGLLLRSFWLLQRVDLGFAPERLVTAQITLPVDRYSSRVDVDRFWTEWLHRLRQLPGVESAAGTSLLPLIIGSGDVRYYTEGRPPQKDADRLVAQMNVVTDDYFRTLGVAVVAGRALGPEDRRSAAEAGADLHEGSVIVSQRVAQRLFPRGDAVGRRLIVDLGGPFAAEIVGVAGDVRSLGLQEEPPDVLYFSQHQVAGNFNGRVMTLCVRARDEPDVRALVPVMRAALRGLEPAVPLANAQSMAQILRRSMGEASLRTRSLAVASVISLLLAVIGVYGVLAYVVTERAREIGVRLALGARPAEIFRMVVTRGLLLVGLGEVLGVVIAWFASRVVAHLLFGITSNDPLVFLAVAGGLLATGFAACAVPARRAMRINPVAALREGQA